MYILIRDFITQASIVKDPYNPGKPLFFKSIPELSEFVKEAQLSDYLIAVADPIYMDVANFDRLVKSPMFETAFKREKKYTEQSLIRYSRHKK